MDRLDIEGVLYRLYDSVNGHEISRQSLAANPQHSSAFHYGEIDFHSFYEILLLTKPQPEEIFYDLGSGTGKAVALAALAFPFAKSIGIEKLPELHLAAQHTLQTLQSSTITLLQNDFLDTDFTNGDVIYLNSYFFNKELHDESFLQQVRLLKPGTRLIYVHTPLIIPELTVINKSPYLFSWGNAMIYIMEKT